MRRKRSFCFAPKRHLTQDDLISIRPETPPPPIIIYQEPEEL